METGTIVRLMDKGYGFISQEGKEDNIFFHAEDLVDADFDELEEGEELSFEVEETPKGLSASNVTRA